MFIKRHPNSPEVTTVKRFRITAQWQRDLFHECAQWQETAESAIRERDEARADAARWQRLAQDAAEALARFIRTDGAEPAAPIACVVADDVEF